MFYRLTLSILLLTVSPAHALTTDSTPVPGGIAIIALPENVDPASARYRDRKILVMDINGSKSAGSVTARSRSASSVRSQPESSGDLRSTSREGPLAGESLQHGLQRRSLRHPLLCLLEDLHWGDASLAAWLEYLVRLHDNSPEDYDRVHMFISAYLGWLPGIKKARES